MIQKNLPAQAIGTKKANWRAGWSPGSFAERNQAPVARLAASPREGPFPLQVLLDGSASHDPEGDALTFTWELPGGVEDDRELLVLSVDEPGHHQVGLRVTDVFGASDRTEVTIVADGGSALFRRGDTNQDGEVNVSDPVRVLLFLFAGNQTPPCLETADVDDSGDVAITDAVYLLSYLFGRGLAPAAPFRECGLDPTEDALSCGDYGPCA